MGGVSDDLTLPADAQVDFEQALAGAERAQAALASGEFAAAWEDGSAALVIAGRGSGGAGRALGGGPPAGARRLRSLEAVAEAGSSSAAPGWRLPSGPRAS